MKKYQKVIIAVVAVAVVYKLTRAVLDRLDGDVVRDFGDPSLKASTDELKRTVITPVLEYPIEPGKNVLWCATFQLAWNEAKDLLGGEIRLEGNPPFVTELNASQVTVEVIDEDSCVAVAGYLHRGIARRIEAELKRKFGEHAPDPQLPAVSDPTALVAYAYLQKDMEFNRPFGIIRDPLTFSGVPVGAFGVDESDEPSDEIVRQVLVFRHGHGDGETIIELKTKSESDRLVLALVRPSPTLTETVYSVIQTVKEACRKAEAGGVDEADVYPFDFSWLKVPKLDFDVLREYHELMGSRVVGRPDDYILAANQDVRFKMDERGVKLRSASRIVIGCAGPAMGLVFDRPFLILMMKRDAEHPYFALWVDNAELLVKAK